MIVVWLKFLHVGAIALWSAGLIALPFLYLQRAGREDRELHRLHAFTRHLYVAVTSPAAFVAIGSGTALILMQGTYANWFLAKLVAVSAMTGMHIFSGLIVLRLFEPGRCYSLGRFFLVETLTSLLIGMILIVVLAKPELEWPEMLLAFFAPGALSIFADQIIGGVK